MAAYAAPAAGPAGWSRSKAASVAFVAGLSVYLAGLLFWLAIGLLPTLSSDVGGVHRWVVELAGRPGLWRPYARRVLHPPMTMPAAASGTTVAVQYLFSLLNLLLGGLLAVRLRAQLVPRLLAFALLGTAATFNHPSHHVFDVIGQPVGVKVIHFSFHIISGVTYLWAVVLFPDGRLPPAVQLSRRARRAGVVAVTLAATVICWRSSFVAHPQFFVVFFGIAVPAAGIPSQMAKMRPPAGPQERQQARLLRAALVPSLVVAVGWLAAWLWVHAAPAGTSGATSLDHWLAAAFPAVFAVVPVMLLIGLLRYRLWDVDVLIGRAVLYTGAVALTAVAYVAVVTAAGAVAAGGAATAVVSMAAAGLVMLPAYQWLRRLANRLAFGQTLDPVEAMRALADGLEHLGPAEELQELARVVVAGTRAVEARVWLEVDDHLLSVAAAPAAGAGGAPGPRPAGGAPWLPAGGHPTASAWGRAVGADLGVPIRHDGELLGVLGVTLPPGVGLPPQEERLVTDLAAEAGLLVRNARMTAELARHIERIGAQTLDLRRTRQRVVEATDRERRLLERDLHDGAQQDLVALILGLRALRAPSSDPGQVTALLEVVDASRVTLEALAGGGSPPALAEGGLGAGLAAATAVARTAGPAVRLAVDVPVRPPPDIEAAVYFCCLEAVQNAAKHARAGSVSIRVTATEQAVAFEVADDGTGFAVVAAADGSGLDHLSERLAVFGGSIRVTSAAGRGTTVTGSVPVPATPGSIDAAPLAAASGSSR